MKLLTIDIETTPHITYTWGLYDQNIAINQIQKPTELLCFAAKWHGEREILFYRGPGMVEAAFDLLNEADALITWNGDRFDIPHLNREFTLGGLGIPSPYAKIDLLKTSRRQFKFASNKLDYVAQALGVGQKVRHPGMPLWLDCMGINGPRAEEKAWPTMGRYNKGDVRITERVYDKMLPWIHNHPSVALRDGNVAGCPNCGSMKATREGYAYTSVMSYQRMRCSACGKWYRGASRVASVSARSIP